MQEFDHQWTQCDACRQMLYRREVERNLMVCPKCNYHFRISAADRLNLVIDEGSFVEFDGNLEPIDLLHFKDRMRYPDRVKESQQSTQRKEAMVGGKGTIQGQPLLVGVMDFEFMGGSMGSVVGEKVALPEAAGRDWRGREFFEGFVPAGCRQSPATTDG